MATQGYCYDCQPDEKGRRKTQFVYTAPWLIGWLCYNHLLDAIIERSHNRNKPVTPKAPK